MEAASNSSLEYDIEYSKYEKCRDGIQPENDSDNASSSIT